MILLRVFGLVAPTPNPTPLKCRCAIKMSDWIRPVYLNPTISSYSRRPQLWQIYKSTNLHSSRVKELPGTWTRTRYPTYSLHLQYLQQQQQQWGDSTNAWKQKCFAFCFRFCSALYESSRVTTQWLYSQSPPTPTPTLPCWRRLQDFHPKNPKTRGVEFQSLPTDSQETCVGLSDINHLGSILPNLVDTPIMQIDGLDWGQGKEARVVRYDSSQPLPQTRNATSCAKWLNPATPALGTSVEESRYKIRTPR